MDYIYCLGIQDLRSDNLISLNARVSLLNFFIFFAFFDKENVHMILTLTDHSVESFSHFFYLQIFDKVTCFAFQNFIGLREFLALFTNFGMIKGVPEKALLITCRNEP